MARNNYAGMLINEGKLADAEVQIRQSLADNPRNAEALRNLGALFEAQGRPGDAIDAYRAAIELNADAKAQFQLGKLLLAQGDARQGMFYLNRALEAYPNYAPAHEELARVLFAQNHQEQAVEELERAIQLDPDLLSAQYHLAAVLLEMGHTPDNDPRLRELIRKFPAVSSTQPATRQSK
jgi:tetratricopeptide (TPR) repeat protein